jgi:hypothetical protein
VPRTTRDAAPPSSSRRLRAIVIGTSVLVLAAGTTACAVVALDPAQPIPDPIDPPASSTAPESAAPATTESPAVAPPAGSSFTEVPLEQGVTMWQDAVPDGASVYFVAERQGDDVTTARVGMGGPRCFFGSAQDGVLQGRYRVVTAGSGLDRQADPLRVKVAGSTLTLTERATGVVVGEYDRIDPADAAAVAAAQAALAACDAVRAAPATATPQ